MFKQIEDASVVLQDKGVYTVHDLYMRTSGELYAKVGAGKFIRLKANGSTSKNSGCIDQLEYEGNLFVDQFGRLAVTGAGKRKELQATAATKLLSTDE